MKNEEKRKYYISDVSLIPHSFGRNGVREGIIISILMGLNGVQVLPLRGRSTKDYCYDRFQGKPFEEWIISFEDRWGMGGLIDFFLNLYLFGRKSKSQRISFFLKDIFGFEKFIDHNLFFKFEGNKYMIEIGSVASTQAKNYINSVDRLVWDTLHVRDKGMPDWKELLLEIPAEKIKMVHFQPKNSKELREFMNGKRNELSEMLNALTLKVNKDCPVVLEIRPTILSMVSIKFLMKKISLIKANISDIMDF